MNTTTNNNTNINSNYHKIGTNQQIPIGSSYSLKTSYSLPMSPVHNSYPGNKKFNFDLWLNKSI